MHVWKWFGNDLAIYFSSKPNINCYRDSSFSFCAVGEDAHAKKNIQTTHFNVPKTCTVILICLFQFLSRFLSVFFPFSFSLSFSLTLFFNYHFSYIQYIYSIYSLIYIYIEHILHLYTPIQQYISPSLCRLGGRGYCTLYMLLFYINLL